jgi:hypothetical protein
MSEIIAQAVLRNDLRLYDNVHEKGRPSFSCETSRYNGGFLRAIPEPQGDRA